MSVVENQLKTLARAMIRLSLSSASAAYLVGALPCNELERCAEPLKQYPAGSEQCRNRAPKGPAVLT